jgi:hypothetical protein
MKPPLKRRVRIMMRQRQVFASLLFGGAVVFVLGLGVLAQSVSLTVTAYSDAVRFSAQGSVKELRVEILALSGQKVFDSGPVLGNALDWKLLNSQGQPVANGVYLYTVTVKDPSGNVTKKLGKLAVLRGKGVAAPPLSGITVGELASGRLIPQAFNATDWFVSGKLGVGTDTPTYKAEVLDDTDALLNETVLRVSRQHPASGQNRQTFFQVENYGNNAMAGSHLRLAFARGSRASPAAVMDGDRLGSLIYSGWDGSTFQNPAAVFGKVVGSVSAGSVPAKLTFETGACFSGCANPRAERMVVMPDGNVGIGTSSPQGFLHVAGPSGANIIMGFSGNSVTSGVVGATISGGGQSGGINQVTDAFGTVGGGRNNQAGDGAGTTSDRSFATVGGGSSNTASGVYATVGGGSSNTASGVYATVGGGSSNTASGGYATVGGGVANTASSSSATVGGGFNNTASGFRATVGGGVGNIASGDSATVGGGADNTAAGDYSFVVGRRAQNTNAAHHGVFLFADSNDFNFPSTAANQFRVRATGGAQFVLGIDASGNPTWTCSVSNGTSWACSSDRNLKENLTLVDGRQVLAQLSALPIYTWSAKGGDPAVRHMGPMAQDFYSIFRLGTDDKTISTIDLDGVALVSIQALYQMSLEKDKKIEEQARKIEELEARLAALEKLVQELSAKK